MIRYAAALCLLCLMTAPSLTEAETSVLRHRDGTSGLITPLGEDAGIYSDAHGNTGPVTGLGTPASPILAPHGDTKSSSITPFGTPMPPSNLTPAPVMPFHPNRPLMPQSTAPASPPSGGGARFGR